MYGCNVWGLTSEENLKKIQVLQKKCIRIMTFSDFNSHTNQLFIDLKILLVILLIYNNYNWFMIFYDNRLPKDLKNLFTFSSDIHTTNHIPGI